MRLSLSYLWTLRLSNSPHMTFVYYACRLSLKRPSVIMVANDNETALCTLLFWCSWQSLATWLPLSFSQLSSLESTAYIKSATIRWKWPAVSLNGWICGRGSRSCGLKNLAAMLLCGWGGNGDERIHGRRLSTFDWNGDFQDFYFETFFCHFLYSCNCIVTCTVRKSLFSCVIAFKSYSIHSPF